MKNKLKFVNKLKKVQLAEVDEQIPSTSKNTTARNSLVEVSKFDLWDGPKEKEEEKDYGEFSAKFYVGVKYATKIFVCFLTVLVIILSAAISNGLVLFMTSQIAPNRQTPFCNRANSSENNIYNYKVISNSEEQAQWMWVLFLTYVTPEALVFLSSAKTILFRKFQLPTIADFLLVAASETLQSIGMSLFIFLCLPELDVIRGIMLMSCVSLVPGILLTLSRTRNRGYKAFFDVLALLSQLLGFILWPVATPYKLNHAVWSTPVSLFLISAGWWANYAGKNSRIKFVRNLNRVKRRLDDDNRRQFVYCFVCLWKIVVFFLTMMAFVYVSTPTNEELPFMQYPLNYTKTRYLDVSQTSKPRAGVTNNPVPIVITQVAVQPHAALIVWIIQLCAAFVCSVAAKFACRIRAQKYSFSVPLSLVIPVTVAVLDSLCGIKHENVCSLNKIPGYLFWRSPYELYDVSNLSLGLSAVWFVWFASQTWISIHIWAPVNEHLIPTNKLFSHPLYSGILVDQSLILTRSPDVKKEVIKDVLLPSKPSSISSSLNHLRDEFENMVFSVDDEEDNEDEYDRTTHNVTRIYACATMWHETFEEMVGLFISIVRMDKDRFTVRYKRANFHYVNKDYYIFETHIFFDDAFKFKDPKKNDLRVVMNPFVETMIKALAEAIKKVYKDKFTPGIPQKMKTPYGGRLVWRLPGRTKLFVHLKDINKIRHRKRWSQVMYMYYLMSYRLLGSDYSDQVKMERAKNTFILALDGDIDFKPEAVRQVVTDMIKDPQIGAACGRIHPVGSGWMTWYQHFEYALGHWLQKATENVTGCVLCSPGCFSLFRGEALIHANVMKTYTTRASQAVHYVQYDQGEDRWLCTLLLKQGFKIVYMAASHAYTHCPVSFAEFYNQRRRWVPSTMANIMDLLDDRPMVVNKNENISNLYIVYQWMMMIGTIMGPGSIFLMLVSSLNVAFGVSNETAMWINLIPLFIFILTCAFTQQKYQLMVAEVLTAAYALMMIGVLVAMVIQMVTEGVLSPSTFFSVLLMGIFVLAAILHPSEFNCLLYFLVYWLVIPSMYLLLIIYSLMNMHDVSWGTREVVGEKTPEQEEQERLDLEESKKEVKDSGSLLNFLGQNKTSDKEGSCGIDCAGLFSIKCCTRPKSDVERLQTDILAIKEVLQDLNKKAENNIIVNRHNSVMQPILENILLKDKQKPDKIPIDSGYWYEEFEDADELNMSDNQTEFWNFIITKYLQPLRENKKEKDKIIFDLKALRNQMAYSFFMINIMFTFTMLLMQQHKDVLSIQFPIQVNSTISYRKAEDAVVIETNYMEMEPIGTFLVVFFGVILFIQLIGMLVHRCLTFTKVMAATKVQNFICKNRKSQEKKEEDLITDANATQLIQHMVNTRPAPSVDTLRMPNVLNSPVRDIIRKKRRSSVHPRDLDQLVDRRISKLERQESVHVLNMPPRALNRLISRRQSIISQNNNNSLQQKRTRFMTTPWQQVPIPSPDYPGFFRYPIPVIPVSDYD